MQWKINQNLMRDAIFSHKFSNLCIKSYSRNFSHISTKLKSVCWRSFVQTRSCVFDSLRIHVHQSGPSKMTNGPHRTQFNTIVIDEFVYDREICHSIGSDSIKRCIEFTNDFSLMVFDVPWGDLCIVTHVRQYEYRVCLYLVVSPNFRMWPYRLVPPPANKPESRHPISSCISPRPAGAQLGGVAGRMPLHIFSLRSFSEKMCCFQLLDVIVLSRGDVWLRGFLENNYAKVMIFLL